MHHSNPIIPTQLSRSEREEREKRFQAMIRQELGDQDTSTIELFRSLMKTNNLILAIADKQLAKFGMSMAKMRLLFMLQYRSDDEAGGLLPSELSKFQGVMPNTITSLVSNLRDQGLIEETQHPHDKRKKIIRITMAGKEFLKQIGPGHREHVDSMLDVLTREEREQMIAMLDKIQKRIDFVGECDTESAESHRNVKNMLETPN